MYINCIARLFVLFMTIAIVIYLFLPSINKMGNMMVLAYNFVVRIIKLDNSKATRLVHMLCQVLF